MYTEIVDPVLSCDVQRLLTGARISLANPLDHASSSLLIEIHLTTHAHFVFVTMTVTTNYSASPFISKDLQTGLNQRL